MKTLELCTKIVHTIIEVIYMIKNITFSVDEKIIRMAREKAARNNMSLNEVFRQWLSQYARETGLGRELDDFLKITEYKKHDKKLTREELNER